MSENAAAPPGWPPQVPPPGVEGWREASVGWLLDQCPADYRLHDVWRRHPGALAWIAARHVQGQVTVMREAYRQARVDLTGRVPAGSMPEVLAALEHEGLRLRATARAATLVTEAMGGKRYVPRL